MSKEGIGIDAEAAEGAPTESGQAPFTPGQKWGRGWYGGRGRAEWDEG